MKRILSLVVVALSLAALVRAESVPMRIPTGVAISQTQAFNSSGLKVSTGQIYAQDGIVMQHETFMDIPLISSVQVYSAWTATATLAAGECINTVNIATIPVNIGVSFDCQYTSRTCRGTVRLRGITSFGDIKEELITSSQCTIAYSSYAYLSIISSTHTLLLADAVIGAGAMTTGAGYVAINYGTGGKIGLANRIISTSDVMKSREGAICPTTAVTRAACSTTYYTYTPALAYNAAYDYDIWYIVKLRR